MNAITLDDFILAATKLATELGIPEFVPIIFPVGAEKFQMISGIPYGVDHRDAIQKMIRKSGFNNSEFYFCVRSNIDELTSGHYTPSKTEFFTVHKFANGFTTARTQTCDWWHVRPNPSFNPDAASTGSSLPPTS